MTLWWLICCQRWPSYNPLSHQWRPGDDPFVVSVVLVRTHWVVSEDPVTTHLVISDDLIMTGLSSVKELIDDSDDLTDHKSQPDYFCYNWSDDSCQNWLPKSWWLLASCLSCLWCIIKGNSNIIRHMILKGNILWFFYSVNSITDHCMFLK